MAYDGTYFSGWQVQRDSPQRTVAGTLEQSECGVGVCRCATNLSVPRRVNVVAPRGWYRHRPAREAATSDERRTMSDVRDGTALVIRNR